MIWKFSTGGPVNSSPVFRDNEVIIGSDDGYLYGINSTSGKMNWHFKTKGPIRSTALIRDDLAYFGSLDGQFYCINISKERSDPILVWKYTAKNGIISSAHYYNGTVIFGDLSGYVYQVGNGKTHWRIRISDREIWSSPIIDSSNGYVYITDIGNRWVKIKLNEGTLKMTSGLSGQTNLYSTGVYDLETLFLVGGEDKKLHALGVSMESNRNRWRFDIGESAYSTPVIQNNRIYLNSINFTWCLPLKYYDDDHIIDKNEVIWSVNTNDTEGRSSPLLAGGLVFSGSGDGNLYCFDQENGEKKWVFPTYGPIVSSPALHDKHIYFGSQNGYIYCIGEKPIEMEIYTEKYISLLIPNGTKEVEIEIIDFYGNPLDNVLIKVNTTLGQVVDQIGSQSNLFITNEHGEVVFYYFPPNITVPATDKIFIKCFKDGYIDTNTTITIDLTQQIKPDDDDESMEISDNISIVVFLTIIFILILFLLILGVIISNNLKKKDLINE